MTRLFCVFSLALFLAACADKAPSSSNTGGRISPTYQGPTETTFCTSVNTFSTPVTITGTAQYVRRNPWGNTVSGGLGSASLSGTHPATAHPIRRAEIRITDSSGTVIQCGETGDSGEISVTLPQGSVNYTLSVNSRSFNSSYLRASVLDRPERNQVYSLQTTVNAASSASVGTLTAAADGDVLGGAFHILDQLYNANQYLRSKVSGFSSAVKVVAYWEKGFNPNNYFGDSSGISFYLPGYSRLFILGGEDGDINSSDTDHFDSSVILHEYGHFLEDLYFESDSPGGSHNGNKIIDPRLAWSEGFGNFFQAAVTYDAGSTPYYIDTFGNDDGTATELMFNTSLETPPLSGSDCRPVSQESANGDCPRATGEGNFREFAVTRMLWDMVDTVNETRFSSTEATSDAFNEIWTVLSSSTNGFNDTKFAFRNAGLFFLSHAHLFSSSDLTGVRGVERMRGDTTDYADYVTPNSSCSTTMSITPSGTAQGTYGDTGSLSTSDLLRNNDFYYLKTTSSQTLQLTYPAGTTVDLDLFVYNESARFGSSADMRAYSRNDPISTATNTESVTLPAGTHLINVNVYTPGSSAKGTPVTYSLKLNGTTLCPTTLVQ